ncbi:hypothetical protein ACF08M_32960 [Streptomyces sp. NPDC015032]|uniref:hypothetical protein n=1 Tax=Streptomyces sp. NPDC015032 TaxID=3364937 RepID=UPI0036FA0251
MSMTIRVSRDGGKTFDIQETYRMDKTKPPPLLMTSVWPPCQCPGCKEKRSK